MFRSCAFQRKLASGIPAVRSDPLPCGLSVDVARQLGDKFAVILATPRPPRQAAFNSTALRRQSRKSAGNLGNPPAIVALFLRCSRVVFAPRRTGPLGWRTKVQGPRKNSARAMPNLPADCRRCRQIAEIAAGVHFGLPFCLCLGPWTPHPGVTALPPDTKLFAHGLWADRESSIFGGLGGLGGRENQFQMVGVVALFWQGFRAAWAAQASTIDDFRPAQQKPCDKNLCVRFSSAPCLCPGPTDVNLT